MSLGLSVRERGDCVATFRWVDVQLMEMLASWVPTTAEMEAKLLFGAHIWDTAQHADWLGRRTYELRLPLQHGRQPRDDYADALTELRSTPETRRRIAGMYEAVLPDLVARFELYLGRVDDLLDAPTVRVLDRIRYDVARMVRESRQTLDEVPELKPIDDGWLESFRSRLAALADFVDYRPARSVEVQPA